MPSEFEVDGCVCSHSWAGGKLRMSDAGLLRYTREIARGLVKSERRNREERDTEKGSKLLVSGLESRHKVGQASQNVL